MADSEDGALNNAVPYLIQALFQDFPGPNGVTRQVRVETDRKPEAKAADTKPVDVKPADAKAADAGTSDGKPAGGRQPELAGSGAAAGK